MVNCVAHLLVFASIRVVDRLFYSSSVKSFLFDQLLIYEHALELHLESGELWLDLLNVALQKL